MIVARALGGDDSGVAQVLRQRVELGAQRIVAFGQRLLVGAGVNRRLQIARRGAECARADGAGGAPKGAARNCGSAACRPVSKGVLTVYLVSVSTTDY